MKELAAECEDTSLLKMLEFYRKHPAKFWAKRLAVMLHQTKHSRIVDLLSERLQQATADYPRRFFGDDVERKYQQALERAKQRQDEAWLGDAPLERFHRIVGKRPQYLTGSMQSRQVPPLLEFP